MKALKVHFSSRYCDIYYNNEFGIVQTVWKEIAVDDEKFHKILSKTIDVLQQTNSNTILTDARKMKMIWKEDREWIINRWYPEAIKAGLHYQALIVKHGSFHELALKQIIDHSDKQQVETMYFNSYTDAIFWAKNKKAE